MDQAPFNPHFTSQMGIESCNNVTVTISHSPMSSMLEITNCNHLDVYLAKDVMINTVSVGQENISVSINIISFNIVFTQCDLKMYLNDMMLKYKRLTEAFS